MAKKKDIERMLNGVTSSPAKKRVLTQRIEQFLQKEVTNELNKVMAQDTCSDGTYNYCESRIKEVEEKYQS